MEHRARAKPYSRPYGEKVTRRHLPKTSMWGTPKAIIEDARLVMDGITTDPCTAPIFQEYIKADIAYTELENGLSKSWVGAVFVNPPVMHGRAFWARLVDDWESGAVEQGMFMSAYPDHGSQLRNRYEAEPYRLIANPAEGKSAKKVLNHIRPFCGETAQCMFNERIKFLQYRPDWEVPGLEESKGPSHGGNFIVYLPPKWNREAALARFDEVFSKHGNVGIFGKVK